MLYAVMASKPILLLSSVQLLGQGRIRSVRNLESRNLVQRKSGTNSQMPLQTLVLIPRLWHKNKRRPRMVVAISHGPLVGCCYFPQPLEGCLDGCPYFLEAVGHIGNELKTPRRKIASDLQILRHDLAHFDCATFCRSKFRLFLVFPLPRIAVSPGVQPLNVLRPWALHGGSALRHLRTHTGQHRSKHRSVQRRALVEPEVYLRLFAPNPRELRKAFPTEFQDLCCSEGSSFARRTSRGGLGEAQQRPRQCHDGASQAPGAGRCPRCPVRGTVPDLHCGLLAYNGGGGGVRDVFLLRSRPQLGGAGLRWKKGGGGRRGDGQPDRPLLSAPNGPSNESIPATNCLSTARPTVGSRF